VDFGHYFKSCHTGRRVVFFVLCEEQNGFAASLGKVITIISSHFSKS
jgi:hypothetical protein